MGVKIHNQGKIFSQLNKALKKVAPLPVDNFFATPPGFCTLVNLVLKADPSPYGTEETPVQHSISRALRSTLMSRNRKNRRRNRQTPKQTPRQNQLQSPKMAQSTRMQEVVQSTRPEVDHDNETVSLRSFKAASQCYNRAILDHLLQYALMHSEYHDEALMLIQDGFGLTKANANHLLTTAHAFDVLPEVRTQVYELGTVDLERLVLVGKQLTKLSDEQLLELEADIGELFIDADGLKQWIKVTTICKNLTEARLTIDPEARARAEARAAAQAEKKRQQQSRLVRNELDDGRTEIIIRIDKEESEKFNNQVVEAAQAAGQDVSDYLYHHVNAAADPQVQLLAVVDQNGTLVVEGCEPMTINNVVDMQKAINEARSYRLSELRALSVMPNPAISNSSGGEAA